LETEVAVDNNQQQPNPPAEEWNGFGFQPTPEPTHAAEETPPAVDTPIIETPVVETPVVETPAPQVIREAYIPQELLDFYTNDDSATLISEIKSQTPYQFLVADVMAKHPSATTQKDIDYWMNKEHPDLDPSIPENLGIPTPEYNELVKRIDDSKQERINQVIADKKAKIEAIVAEATPKPVEVEQVSDEVLTQQITDFVDKQVAAFDKSVLPEVAGLELPDLDMVEVRKRALEGNRLASVEIQPGQWDIMPDVTAVAREMRLQAIIDAQKPMVEAYKRLDPEVYKKAVQQSLNNLPVQTTAPAVDPTRNDKREQPSAFGFGSGQYPGENQQQ